LTRVFISCALYLGLLGGSTLSAIGAGVPSLTPAQKAIHDAASIQAPRQREDALREAVSEGLLSSDPAIRNQVFAYLSQNSRWIDLRPYAEIIEDFSKMDPLHRGVWLLDDNELAHASRAERLAAYRAAILDGVTRLARGRPLTRESAISFAASEGMVELEPLATQFSPLVEERWKNSFGFEALPTLFHLGEGAKDVEDAGQIVAGRLRAMDDDDLYSRMWNDSGFRSAVLQVARNVCAPNPFSGRRNPGCADLSNVLGRQAALKEKKQKAVVEPRVGTVTTERGDDWLSQLRHYTPPAGPQ
jgi:hypothetical protein